MGTTYAEEKILTPPDIGDEVDETNEAYKKYLRDGIAEAEQYAKDHPDSWISKEDFFAFMDELRKK